ncbi:lipopolysaccharide assembly protein LapA domain-containing protein [Streptomyces sp. NPDC007369]|uniref:lipopolysaccharide assembly protein LapA domain-containing protein n=1 Tax=Streptomyces sp. NPDC007369 TaxID=3154589 RepID=UPI0033D137F3
MARKASARHQPPTLTVKGHDVRLRTIGFVVLAALAVWFIAANTGPVPVRLWFPTVEIPLWVVLTVTLVVGIALGVLLARRRGSRR